MQSKDLNTDVFRTVRSDLTEEESNTLVNAITTALKNVVVSSILSQQTGGLHFDFHTDIEFPVNAPEDKEKAPKLRVAIAAAGEFLEDDAKESTTMLLPLRQFLDIDPEQIGAEKISVTAVKDEPDDKEIVKP
jgi:hypothetical protein